MFSENAEETLDAKYLEHLGKREIMSDEASKS